MSEHGEDGYLQKMAMEVVNAMSSNLRLGRHRAELGVAETSGAPWPGLSVANRRSNSENIHFLWYLSKQFCTFEHFRSSLKNIA